MNIKKNSKSLLIITLVLISSIAGYFAIETGRSYVWYSKTDEIRYAGVLWNKIIISKLDGLTPKLAVSEKRIKLSDDHSGPLPGSFTRFLMTDGGGDGAGYWLEVYDNSLVNRIDSLDKLKEVFGPVDSEAEAVSFVGATTRYVKAEENGNIEAYTAIVSDGYLVRVMLIGTRVCGNIKSNSKQSSVVYKVSKSGDIQEVASEAGPMMCIN